jgi:hypothetical protein
MIGHYVLSIIKVHYKAKINPQGSYGQQKPREEYREEANFLANGFNNLYFHL